MEVLTGLFRSNCEFLTSDNFGGNKFEIFSYSYLLFYCHDVFAFSLTGNSENFEVKNVIESIYKKETTLLNGIYSINKEKKIVCDFEFKPFMAGRLKLVGEIINKNFDLKFNAFSNDKIFWSNKIYYIQNITNEITYLLDKGVKNVTLKDGTNLNLDEFNLNN